MTAAKSAALQHIIEKGYPLRRSDIAILINYIRSLEAQIRALKARIAELGASR